MERFFTLLGFKVSQEGVVTTTTLFAKVVCRMLVRSRHFIKISNNIYKKTNTSMERIAAKDLQVGTEYWLDDTNVVSGVCTEVNQQNDTVYFDPVPGQPERYLTNSKGKITFPVRVPYEYLKVEA